MKKGDACTCDSCGKRGFLVPPWREITVDVARELEPNRGYTIGDLRQACSDECEARIRRGVELNKQVAKA